MPWLGQSLVGTTDTDYFENHGEAHAKTDDINDLLESIRPFIHINLEDVRYSYAGVRALAPEEGPSSLISRKHLIVDEAAAGTPGLIGIVGGKVTGYKAIAEEAGNAECSTLGVRRESRTKYTPARILRANGLRA